MTATSLRVTDILMHMIATFLAPMFLTVTGGDFDQARAAAIATVRSCTARNPMDLLLIGQMIALGLATLSSVSLSMAEDIPINLILRLRGNAVSLHRTSERCRLALPEPDPSAAAQHAPLPDLDPEVEVPIAQITCTSKPEVPANLAQPPVTPNPSSQPAPEAITDAGLDFPESLDAMKAEMARIVAESERRAGDARPAADVEERATPRVAPQGAPAASERILRAAWSYAMPDAAPQAFDDLAGFLPTERRAGSMRAEALSTTANQLINGTAPPPR